MKNLNLESYGKINLILDVIGKRPDGYHEVVTILQKIELHDQITLALQKRGIKITCNHPKVPLDNKNIVYKATRCFLEKHGIDSGVRIHIEKRIPVEAGFGGGSSNAACVLVGLNKLLGLSVSNEKLFGIAASLGADVPFFLQNKTCLATGKGEQLKQFENNPQFDLVIVVPEIEFPKDFEKSKWAYKMIDEEIIVHPNTTKMIRCFEKSSWNCVVQNLGNVFESMMFKKFSIIKTIKEKLIEYGCVNALMTGAGLGVYGIVKENNCEEVSEKMKKYGNVITTKTK